jgi:hypothetical protein
MAQRRGASEEVHSLRWNVEAIQTFIGLVLPIVLFARPSQWSWKPRAPKPSPPHRHRSEICFLRNSSRISGKIKRSQNGTQAEQAGYWQRRTAHSIHGDFSCFK